MENIINNLLSSLIMADKDDFHELENIRALFLKFADIAGKENVLIVSLAVNSAAFIEKIISGEISDRKKGISVINNAVHAIEAWFETGEDACLNISPEDLPGYKKEMSFIHDIDKNLLIGFIAETRDRLDSADQHLLILESNPGNEDSLHGLFRIFHTIKGDAGVLSYNEMAELSHVTEDLLSIVRSGNMVFSPILLNLVFESTELLRNLTDSLEYAVSMGQKDLKPPSACDLVYKIKKILQNDRPRKIGEILLKSGAVTHEQLEQALKQQQTEKEKFESVNLKYLTPADNDKSFGKIVKSQDSMVKINANQLDHLFNTVGELSVFSTILTQNKTIFSYDHEYIVKNISFLEKTTRDLLSLCSALRLMPIKPVFNKMARLVRVLSKSSGKEIEFKVIGEDTEFDRAIVEQIDEPLIHLIRNAIDHGIEPLSERLENSKQAKGIISLNAFYKGESVYIKVSDDGRGLDRDKIFKTAVKQGIISPDAVMTDQEVYKLIFTRGFSTAGEITALSGRGVGMDVLKQTVDSLGGTIELSSKKNKGTNVTIRVPMTLAMIDGIIIQAGKEKYIVSTLFIKEILIINPHQIHMNFGNQMTIDYRGTLIPFYRLSQLTGIQNTSFDFREGRVVIIDSDLGQEVALYVDRLMGQQHFVVKKLDKILSRSKNISGSVIMPDGTVSFILDIDKIISGIEDINISIRRT